MKNVIAPKGQSPKIKCAISNVPVNEIDNICDSLSRTADFNGLALVKLERKAEDKGHVLF